MGRFAVGGSAGFALGPLIAGGVYVFGAHFLWVFTAIALLGVLMYIYAFTDKADVTNASDCESHSKSVAIGTNDWVSFGKLFFVIASRSILFSVLSILFQFCILLLLMVKPVHRAWHLRCTLPWGAVLTYMGGALSDKLGFLKNSAF